MVSCFIEIVLLPISKVISLVAGFGKTKTFDVFEFEASITDKTKFPMLSSLIKTASAYEIP